MPKITKKSEKTAPQIKKQGKIPIEKSLNSKTSIKTEDKNGIVHFIGKKGLLVSLSLIIFISLLVFKDFIFMKFIYMFKDIGSDSINVDYSASIMLSNLSQHQSYFTWSFYSGLGYPVNSGILHPFHPLMALNIILMPLFELIFGSNSAFLKFPVFLTILILTGITAYLYFRTLDYSGYISGIGCLLVAFMGYNIASSAWNHYYDVFYGIFLLFAFEQFYKKKRWYFIPIAVLMISYNFFNLYIYGLFLITYILFRYFSENSSIKNLLILGLKILGLSVLGLLMGAINSAPNLINALNSPRVSENIDAIKDISKLNPSMNNHAYELSTELLRTFSPDIMGTGNEFKGWYNYLEAPLFYCGLISLLLIAQIFVFLKKKDKIVFGSFAGLWLLVIIIPGFRHALHLFIGNYYKVGINFFIPILLIFYGIKSLSLIIENKKISLPVLAISLIVLLIALYYPYKIENIELTDKSIKNYSAILLLLYSGFLFLLGRERYQSFAQIAILVLLVIELTGFSIISISKRDYYKASEFRVSQGGYNDNTMPALEYLKSIDKNFYRTEKDYSSGTAMHGSLNDSQAQGYFGTCLYSSYNQPYYVEFLKETGIIKAGSETATRWAPGLRGRPLLQTFASVKYNLSKSEKPFFLNTGYSALKEFGDVKLIKNVYFIPFGYCYSHYITKSDFEKCGLLQKDISLLRAFVIDENSGDFNYVKTNFKHLQLADTVANFDFDKYKNFVEQRKKDTLQISEFKQNYIKGTLYVDYTKMFFASIPFDKGWKVKVDGKNVEPIVLNIGFIGFPVQQGKHLIEMKFFPGYLYFSFALTIIGALLYLIMFFLAKEFKIKIKLATVGIIIIILVVNYIIF